MEWLTYYVLEVLGSMRGEPYLNILPWVFAVTPEGWSSLIDAYDLEGLDGLRGVVSTDIFFDVPPLWQYQKLGRFEVPKGIPLTRVLPIPRWLLKSEFQRLSAADASASR